MKPERRKARDPKESQIRGEDVVGNKEWPEREDDDMRLSPINTKRKTVCQERGNVSYVEKLLKIRPENVHWYW